METVMGDSVTCLAMLLLSQVCAYNMPPAELEGLRVTFEAIDKNHSGTVSLEELGSHLQVRRQDIHARKAHGFRTWEETFRNQNQAIGIVRADTV